MEVGTLDQSGLTQEHRGNCINIFWPETETRIRLADAQNLLTHVQNLLEKHDTKR